MKKTIKLGFQGWFLSKPYTGIGAHSLGLLSALKKKNIELYVVTPETLKPKFWLIHPSLKKWYWERIQVPAFFARKKLDWEYYPYPCPLPQNSNALRAMTIHDTILWTDKRYHKGRSIFGSIKSYYHKQARRSMVYMDHLFTVSNATHHELGIPSATILPNAINLPKRIPIISKYKNALTYLGGYDIRKNVPALVKAFKQAKKHHPELELILIGEPHGNSKYYPEIPELEAVIKLGALKTEKVYSILKSSFAFVHFSDSEGFNIPLLEAMSLGTPAIVPDIKVNREISSNSALFFDLSQKDPLSNKISLIKDKKKRSAIIRAEKIVASKFSWENSAKMLLKALDI